MFSIFRDYKINALCFQEIFKIPKRERIELMKEHERQANEPHTRRERDKEAGVRRTRWEERYSRPDRDKKRSRPPSPEAPRRPQIRCVS